ncbi:MAG: hypothetical protein WCJ18_00270 [Planctomycetota bacterium]
MTEEEAESQRVAALMKGKYEDFVWLHGKRDRLSAFVQINQLLDNKEYWSLLGRVWRAADVYFSELSLWRDILEDPLRGYGEFFMVQPDRKFFELSPAKGGLAPIFTVYRGFGREGGEDGFSWTMNRDVACGFAQRFRHSDDIGPWVATGTISRKDVIGYMHKEGEREIVCLPENVYAIELEQVR